MADDNGQQENQGGQTAQISGTVQIKPQGDGKQQGGGEGAPQGGQGKPDEGKKPDEKKEDPAKKKRRKYIIIAVVVVLVIGALLWYWRSTYSEDTDDAQVDGNLYQVSSRVMGQVAHVDVEENQMVQAGDPIAEIDPSDLKVALAQAEADLANAQAQYVQATENVPITHVSVNTQLSTSTSDVLGSQASVLQAQANVSAQEANVEQARANALKAQLDVDRYTPLVAKDVISKQQFDGAVATAAATKAQLSEAQRSVNAQQQQVKLAQERLAQSREQQQQNAQNGPKQVKVEQARAAAALATVQQDQAKVDQAQLNLSYAKIVAPVTGIVSEKTVSQGENLSVGQSLLTIVPLSGLWVTANFKETQLKEMQQGQKVDIKVDALSGRHFKGVVTQIGGATGSLLSLFPPENATGNYVKVVQRIPVRIDFTNLKEENKDHALRPGMSVTPTVTVKE